MNRATSLALQFVLLAIPASALALYLPYVWQLAVISHTGHVDLSAVQNDITFVSSNTKRGERIGIVALNEGTLYAETNTRAALNGPGVAEMIRKVDLQNLENEIDTIGPQKLFIGSGLEISYGLLGTDIPIDYLRLQKHYALAAWGPGERLLYLHRKPFAGSDLFLQKQPLGTWHGDVPAFTGVWGARTGGTWGQPLPIRYGLGKLRLGHSFSIRMLVRPAQQDGNSAYLFSQFWKSPNGFIIERDSLTADGYDIKWGNGALLQTTRHFHLPVGHLSELFASYEKGRLRLTVNGHLQLNEDMKGLALDDVPAVIGGWYGPESLFSGEIREIEVFHQAIARQ